MIVFLPWRLEFGTMLMHWVRYVHIRLSERPSGVRSVVCCRPGDEPLFPLADDYFYEWEDLPDNRKKWSTYRAGDHQGYLNQLRVHLERRYPGAQLVDPPRKFAQSQVAGNFRPQPVTELAMGRGAWPEVLIAPRYREHGAHRNYQHWAQLYSLLVGAGLGVGLLGVESSSIDMPGCRPEWKAWSYDDNLSATLCLMKHARAVVTTDSGIAHLAVLAGAPLGVIYDGPGVEAGKPEWPWAFDHMKTHAVNDCYPIIGAWRNPRIAADWARRQVAAAGEGR